MASMEYCAEERVENRGAPEDRGLEHSVERLVDIIDNLAKPLLYCVLLLELLIVLLIEVIDRLLVVQQAGQEGDENLAYEFCFDHACIVVLSEDRMTSPNVQMLMGQRINRLLEESEETAVAQLLLVERNALRIEAR